MRTQALIGVASDRKYQLVKASRDFLRFRREYLRAESVVALAEGGCLEQTEARLGLFVDVDQDWQAAARLILAWLAVARNRTAAQQLRDSVARSLAPLAPLPLLLARVDAALAGQPIFPVIENSAKPLEFGRQLVNRISGQAFDQELLTPLNSSLIASIGLQSQVDAKSGYASYFDAPTRVDIGRVYGVDGTKLVDEYVDAHAGYNYVEYRNRLLWHVLHAVLHNHPSQDWARDRLGRGVVAALSGGGVDFEEMLPLAMALASERAHRRDDRALFNAFEALAFQAAQSLQSERGANDSWGSHRRRLAALMELSALSLGDAARAQSLLARIHALPDGFAGFLAPAHLRVADALRACRMDGGGRLAATLDAALRSAHHIQDYHFCARVTARCNALVRWHGSSLSAQDLAAVIRRLALAPGHEEFVADHAVHEPYVHRPHDAELPPIARARDAATIHDLVEVFQRSAVEFRMLNPQHAVDEQLPAGTLIRVPDPGFAPLLAVHLAARALSDAALDERAALIRSLVPIAAANPTALDSVLSYLALAADLQDAELIDEIAAEAGPVHFDHVPAPLAQIGPDAVMPA